jgi:hypothetical protein
LSKNCNKAKRDFGNSVKNAIEKSSGFYDSQLTVSGVFVDGFPASHKVIESLLSYSHLTVLANRHALLSDDVIATVFSSVNVADAEHLLLVCQEWHDCDQPDEKLIEFCNIVAIKSQEMFFTRAVIEAEKLCFNGQSMSSTTHTEFDIEHLC